ncbi:DUF1493 family protein [Pantoea sp. S-LA4]|jgi:hypothetical protein|uniref:DUF1493 family protein n=1 Tax=Pantoea TaxID=53335 RepID=UPI001F3F93ED|nr:MULTISPECIES: DUF1493 family protein [Pantoea]UIL51021.1 DUF1493 family protein [Pantoea agglomerans]
MAKPCTPQAVIALIEYHNQPTALGWFRRTDRHNFYLQQLPLNEVEFALLMSDFFLTFDVCSQHYDEDRYFPASDSLLSRLTRRMGIASRLAYRPLTVAMLCEAASLGRWPEEDYWITVPTKAS